MFVVGTGVPDGQQQTNFGREIVFSADLCYNSMGDENGQVEKSQEY